MSEQPPRKRGPLEQELAEKIAHDLIDIMCDESIHPSLRLEVAKMAFDLADIEERLDDSR